MTKHPHPHDRAERRRSAEARALEKLKHKAIEAKKRRLKEELRQKEKDDEVRSYLNGVGETVD